MTLKSHRGMHIVSAMSRSKPSEVPEAFFGCVGRTSYYDLGAFPVISRLLNRVSEGDGEKGSNAFRFYLAS